MIGLGGVGSAALYHLAGRGLRVLGIEARGLGHDQGSSHGATRVIRKAYSEDPRYVPLLERSYQLWRELESEIGETLLWITGALHFGPAGDPALDSVREAVTEHDLPHELLDAPAIAERWPGLAPAPDDAGILEPDGGFLAVERCVVAHLEAAASRGAELRACEPVVGLTGDGGEVVIESVRDRYRARSVVLCLGAWSAAGSDSPLAIDWPLVVTRQVQCWLAPLDRGAFELGRFPVFIRNDRGDAYYGLPRWRHPGVKVCRHHGGEVADPASLDRTPRDADVDEVRAFVSRHLPRAAGPLVDARVCMYTSTPDHHFAIGPHPEMPGAWVAAGFSGHGFKLSPVVGEILADLAVSGRTANDIELFDPARFKGNVNAG